MKHIPLIALCLLRVVTVSYGGSPFAFSGSSREFIVDTRPDVMIEDVVSRYCSGQYGGQGGVCATFLTGIHCDVEFRIHASGRDGNPISHYLVNGQRRDMDTFTFDMGDLSPHGTLQVVGVDYAGKRSAPFRVNVEIATLPPKWNYNPLLGTIVVADKHPRQGLIIYRTLVISPLSLFEAEFDDVEFGEKPSSFEFAPKLHIDETMDTSTGQYCFGVEGGAGLGSKAKTPKKAGRFDILDIFYGLKGGIALNYNPQTGNWDMAYNELGVTLEGSVKVRKRLPQFPLVYGEFGLLSSASIVAHYEDEEWRSEIALKPIVAIRATAGIGMDPALAAEVSGEAGIHLEASRPGGVRRAYLRGEVFWRAVLATHERSGTWWEGEFDIYQRPGLSGAESYEDSSEARLQSSPRLALSDVSASSGGGYTDSGFRPVPRNYGEGLEPAVRRSSGRAVLLAASSSGNTQILMHDGYPTPQPAIAVVGTDAVLVYVRDNAARADLDRTELVFREEALDGSWSGESHVWDDGTADFQPKLVILPDGTAVAAWANAKRTFADDTTFEDVCASLESAVGVRDPRSGMWTCANLTDDAALDWVPVLKGATNGTAVVAWVRNAAGAYIGTTEQPSDLAVSFYRNGAWTPMSIAVGGIGAVLSHDIAWDGERAVLAWAADADGDLATEDTEIWAESFENGAWSSPVRLSAQAAAAMRPSVWYLTNGVPHVVWGQDGTLFAADGLTAASGTNVAATAELSIPGDYRVTVRENGSATFLWATASQDSKSGLEGGIVSADYTPGAGLAASAALLKREGYLRNLSGVMDTNGTFRVAYESVAVSTNGEGRLVHGAVDLAVTRRDAARDVGVTADGCSFANSVEIGLTNKLLVGFQDYGTVASGTVGYRVWIGEGEGKMLLASGEVDIPPLSREVVEVPWTPAEGITDVAFTMEVDPDNAIGDSNRENNTLVWRPDVGSPSLSIRNAKAVIATDSLRLISARIHNDSIAPLPAGMTVKFWRGEIGGELIGTDSAGIVSSGTAGEYDVGIAWDISGVAFTSEWERVVIELPTEQGGRSVAVWTPTPLYDSDNDLGPGGGGGGGSGGGSGDDGTPSAPPNIGGIIGFGEVDGCQRFHFSFYGEAGFSYLVQHKERLTDAEWTTIETITPSSTGECPVAVPIVTSAPSGFYRIKLVK